MNTKKCIEKFKNGTPDEIEKAKKEFKNIFLNKNKSGMEYDPGQDSDFKELFLAMQDFKKMADNYHRAEFVKALKWPMSSLGGVFFEFFADFVLALIQHPSGNVRLETVRSAESLAYNLYPLDEDDLLNMLKTKGTEEKEEARSNMLTNQNRLGYWALETNRLLDEYNEPRFEKCKDISEFPSSVYKSLQMLMVDVILPSEKEEKIYKHWMKEKAGAPSDGEDGLYEEEKRAPTPDNQSEKMQWLNKAEEFVDKRFYAGRAVTILKRFLETYPNYPFGHYLLGIARMKSMKFNLAEKAFKKALTIDSDDVESLRSLGHTQVMMGEVEKGRENIREALKRDTMFASAYCDLGFSYLETYEFDKAFEFLEVGRALSNDSKFAKMSINMAKDKKEDFENMSKKERERVLKDIKDPKYHKQKMVQFIQKYIEERPIVTKDELDETREELEILGFGDLIGSRRL